MNSEAIIKALDKIEDGLLIVDREFIIEYANDAANKIITTGK